MKEVADLLNAIADSRIPDEEVKRVFHRTPQDTLIADQRYLDVLAVLVRRRGELAKELFPFLSRRRSQ